MSLDSEFPERVDHLAEEFVDRCRRGEQVSIEEYVSRYPELAEFIRDLFPTLLTVEKLKLPQGDESRLDASVDAVRQQSSQWPCFTDYKIIREIARGGMGIVYEAEQRSLSRRVAIKVLASPHLSHNNLKQRFLNEARSLATLHHTNIIPIFEVGEEDGVDYYSMQYIDGESLHYIQAEVASLLETKRGDESDAASSLAQRLAQSLISDAVLESNDAELVEPQLVEPQLGPVGSAGGEATSITVFNTDSPLDNDGQAGVTEESEPEETARPTLRSISGVRAYCLNIAKLGVQAADAVDYAHRKGIIHRDIKPANLLFDRSGTLWIADFGLAKFEEHDLTRTGDVIGTLRYMAPERFNRTCDERSDIYSLGLSIYEMLALRPAFEGPDQLALLERIRANEPRLLLEINPYIPRDLETIVFKSIHKLPERRYQSAIEFKEDLECFVQGRPIKARQVSAVERLVIWAKHKPLVASLALTLIFVVLGASVGSAVAAFKFRELAVAQVELSAIAKQEAENAKRLAAKADSEARRAEQLAIESEQNLYFAEMKEAARSSLTSSGFRQVLSAVQRWDGDANHSVTRGWEWYWLDSQGNQPVFTIDQRTPQPTEEVRNVVWSPDGKYLAWSILREIHIMDFQTREEITLDHPGCRRVMDFCFSPCGNYLASGTYGDGLIVWDWQERARIQHNRRFATISAVDWHPNGDWLAVHSHTASDQGNALLLILEWRKDQVLHELSEGLRHESERVQFSPDGDYLASLVAHCSARIWNVETGEVVAEAAIPGIHPVGLDWHPDKPLLALCGLGNQIVLWEFVSGETSQILASDEMYFAVHWDRSGRYLLAGGRRNTARVWDLQTGREVLVLKGHTSWVTGGSWNGPGQLIATCSRDQTIKVWNPLKPPAMSRLAAEQGAVHLPVRCCWNPVYPVFVAGAPQHIQIWKADEASLGGYRAGAKLPAAGGRGDGAEFSVDGKWLAFVDEQSVVICDVHTEEIVARHDVEFQHRYDRLRVWGFHPRTNQLLFTYMKYVPLNPYQVTGYFWSPEEASPVPCFEKTGDIIDLEFHPGGEEIWCNSGVIVERIDLQDGALLSQFYPQRYNVLAIRFCPQHGLVAFAGESQIVSIFSAEGGERIVDLEGHTDAVFGVAWNSRHKRLATGSADGTVIIWDTETWQQAAQFQLDGEVGSLDWGAEGRVLMCSTNGAIYLWDATRGFERSKR